MAWGIWVVQQTPAPGAEDAEPVILIPVGLPCLERGRLHKKTKQKKVQLELSVSLRRPHQIFGKHSSPHVGGVV